MKNKIHGFLIIVIILFPTLLKAQGQPGQEIIGQVIQGIENQYYDTTYQKIYSDNIDKEAAIKWAKVQVEISTLIMSSIKPVQIVDTLLKRIDDPSLRVLTPKQFKSLNTEITAKEHIGIGLPELLSVDIDQMTHEVKIIAPIPNSPAAKAGLRPNDVIISINKTPVEGLQLEEVMDLMRFRKGKKVKLIIKRNGKTQKIKIKTAVVQQGLEPYFKVIEHDGKKIGCIWFPQFTNAAAPQFQDIIQQFESKDVNGILLDLRNNPGGLLLEAQRIGGFCMGQKGMGRTTGKSNYLSVLPTLEEKITDLPMVVLTNNGTASAAELLAGSLQYEKRAIIIGERTNGKGLIHTFIPLVEGYVMACSVARIRLLDGRDLLTKGVEPDIIVKNEKPFVFGQVEDDQQFLRGLDQF